MANTFRSRLMASSLLAGAAFAAQPVYAQATPDASTAAIAAPASAASPTTPDAGEIVVTGSLIRNPNLTSSAPVLVTDRKEIDLKQSNTAESLLRDIPGIVPAIGSNTNNGNNGYATVNLRGLGDNRNVVLLDGVRIVPATLTGVVDLNDIPVGLLQRVDVLTGGYSTVYGADAVSGVVNFVTRQNFQGVEITGSEQLTEQGDGNVRRVDVLTGINADDNRGNVTLALSYQKSDAVYDGDRSFARNSIESLDASAGGGSSTDTTTTFNFGAGGKQFNSAGALVPAFSSYNFNPFNVIETPFKRFNIMAQGHYEVADNIEVYSRALYSRNTVNTIVAPSGVFGQDLTFSLNNPYLTDGERTQLCAAAGVATCTPDTKLTAVVKRRTAEVGNRISSFQTDVFDYHLGVRGDITSRIKFDAYGSYGQSDNTQTLQGYTSVSRLQQGLLLNDDGSCTDASNGCTAINIFGPPGSISAAQAAFLNVQSTTRVKTSLAQAHASISGDFGVSSPLATNPISFAVGTEYRRYKASQDADELAESPGDLGGAGSAVIPFTDSYSVTEGFGELNAPIAQNQAFAHNLSLDAGIRYSHYKINGTNNSFNTTTYKGGGVWEPVAGIEFRGDYSHAVRAPNINELFEPRAVGLTNLLVDPCAGAAPTTNANLAAVCRAQGAPASSIGNIANPSAGQPNILNEGNINLKPEKANTITLGTVLQPRNIVPGLTLSVEYYHIKITDAISTPAPGDSISNCYNNITAASATSAACLLIHRDPTTGGLDGDQAGTGTGLPGQFSNSGTLLTSGIDLNVAYKRDLGFAKLDLNFAGTYVFKSKFRSEAGGFFRECVGYYSSNCGIGGGESTGSLLPKYQWSQRTTLDFGKITTSLLWRHISKMKFEPAALADEYAGAAADPADCGTAADYMGADPGGCVVDPQFRKMKAANYFDLTTQVHAADHLTLTFEVINLANKKPPIVGSDIGSTAYNSANTYPSTYDALGRRFVATAQIDF